MKGHRSIGIAVVMLASSHAAFAADPAAAPTKAQCIAANESAQSLRQSGQLRASRVQLLQCVSKSCPELVREDCAARLNEVENATPTIVFVAKTADGNDLSAVQVKMDGALLADHLDGTAIAVEPGSHTFELATAGHPSITKKLVVYEGVKGRDETVTFATAAATPVIAPAPVTTSPPVTTPPEPATPPDEPAPESSSNGKTQRILGLALGGAGVVGLGVGTVFGLVANSTYHDAVSHCPTSTTCNSDGVDGGSSAHTQAAISTVAFIAGGALLAGGVVLYLTAPKRSAVSVQTTAGPGAMGLRIGGAF